MIVQCPQCSSRYRLDENRLSGKGGSVRCSKCQKVFPVLPPSPGGSSSSPGITPSPAAGKKILVGDDAPFFRTMVSDILQEGGYIVETASDGAEILAKVASFLPDLLVLDIQLPDMSGFEVVKRIRGGEVLPHLPILAMSAVYTDSSHVMALDDVGANDYISKKFEPDHLLGRISKILEREASPGNV